MAKGRPQIEKYGDRFKAIAVKLSSLHTSVHPVAWKVKVEEMASKRKRDIEKRYPKARFVAKLRRLADAIENGKRFAIQVGGERVFVPAKAEFNIEHERSGGAEEIEFQIKWTED